MARRLNLTKASVASIIAQLEEAGLVQEAESIRSAKAGRPGISVEVRPEGRYFIGIEIGVDRMNLVTMDLAGRVVHQAEKHERFSGKPESFVFAELAKLYRAALARLGRDARNLREVRVAVPGYVRDGDYLIDAKILGWSQVPLGEKLSRRLDIPVKIENDANASAFAEWYLSKELRPQSIYLLLLESGVGGACIANGRLALGSNGLAGEIGHARFMLGSAAGGARRQATVLQDLIGKAALLSNLKDRGVECMGVADLLNLLSMKNAAASDATRDWAEFLGAAASFVSLAYDVQNIVLGGEMAGLFAFIEPTVVQELKATLPLGFPVPALRKAQFIDDGGAVGAAALAHAAALKAIELSGLDGEGIQRSRS
jgi:predicted NBD/HSP70 family sugar kinase